MGGPYPLTLRGVRILVTTPGAGSARLRDRLEEEGAEVVDLPTIAVVPAQDDGPLREAMRYLSRYGWVAFTSRNAVRAVFECLHLCNLPETIPPTVRVAAVGTATAADLERRGIEVTCVPREATATALADAMRVAGAAGEDVLLPLGDRARSDLRDGLEAAGARVHGVVAYRTVLPTEVDRDVLDRLRRGEIDVVALASPSAAENLLTLLGSRDQLSAGVRLACIGPTTAAAVRDLGMTPAVVAEEHTLDGLAAAIRDLYEMDTQHDAS